MNSRRNRHRVALALLACGVLGSSLVCACLYRGDKESIYDVIRADASAGTTAQNNLQFADAEQHFRRVVELTQPSIGDNADGNKAHVWALVRLGSVLEDQGRYNDAEGCYKDALRLSNPTGNPYDESPILPLSHLKGHYELAGDSAQAEEYRAEIDSIVTRVEPIYLDAIELQRKVYAENGKLLADNLMALANLYYARGETKRAEPLYAEVFAMRSKNRATGGDVLSPLIRMGLANADSKQDSAATEIFKETLAVRESQYGPTSPMLINNLYNLGILACRQDRFEEADSLFSRALSIEEERLGVNHPYSAPILINLADCSRQRGKFESARAYQLRVIGIHRRVFGETSHMVGAGLLALAEIESAAGDRAAARAVCAEALEVTTKASGADDSLTVECESTMRRLSRYMPDPKSGADGDET